MFSRFTLAIVRPPASNFAEGLTTVDLGSPDVDMALFGDFPERPEITSPGAHAMLRPASYTLEPLAMRELAKMKGAISCLALRF